jgi:hypothetical protein
MRARGHILTSPAPLIVAGVIGDTTTLFAAAVFAVGAVVISTIARVAAATASRCRCPRSAVKCCLPRRPRPLAASLTILSLAASIAAAAPIDLPVMLRFAILLTRSRCHHRRPPEPALWTPAQSPRPPRAAVV